MCIRDSEYPDLTEAGGAREEDDKQYPSRDGALIMEEAGGTQEENEEFLSWDGAISIGMRSPRGGHKAPL